MSRCLKGKTVFITGGSRGIGFTIAKKLAADGANIAIAARTVQTQHQNHDDDDNETIFSAAKKSKLLINLTYNRYQFE